MKIAQPIIIGIMPESSALLIFRGALYGHNDGSIGAREPEYFTLSQAFIREHHEPSSTWEKVRLKKLEAEIQIYKNDAGFELIAKDLGIARPVKLH